MLWTPQKGIVRSEHTTGDVGSANLGTAVTTGASANTKGTPVQLIAATAFEAYWVTVLASQYGLAGTTSAGCLDILIGSATEEILIPDLLMGFCGLTSGQGRGPKRWDFPLHVPAGSRIAAQAAGERLSTAMRVAIFLRGGNGVPAFRFGSKVTTYGIGTVPDGTPITAGATGAAGAWTQIAAATSEDHFALVPSFQCSADTSVNIRAIAVQMGIGAAAAEKLVGETYWFGTDGGELMDGPMNSFPHFQDIPAGTRLAMRASNSGAPDTTNGVIHAVS